MTSSGQDQTFGDDLQFASKQTFTLRAASISASSTEQPSSFLMRAVAELSLLPLATSTGNRTYALIVPKFENESRGFDGAGS